MARDGSFLYQFLHDFWDLLPTEDKELLAAYWHALTMIVADIYQETFESSLAIAVEDVPVFHTQRWCRYQLNSNTCDIQSIAEEIVLTGTTPQDLEKDAILFGSLVVTNENGSIVSNDQVTLEDTNIYNLTYDNIQANTLRVLEGSAVFVKDRDYSVNLQDGTIARIENGGIPSGTLVDVYYTHPYYKENVDYTIDQTNRQITRVDGGSISSGQTVFTAYNYDNTSEVPLSSTTGIISSSDSRLSDTSVDFSGVQENRTITILVGLNIGTYTVKEVISSTVLEINETFAADEVNVTYSINAFPYAINVDSNVSSVPTMQDLIVDPTIILREGVDYTVGDSKISFVVEPVTTRENDGPTLWAEETLVNEETVYRNFGVLIDFFRESSEEYLNAVRGLWYVYWTGSTHENLLIGMQILLGLPFATSAGTVTEILTEDNQTSDVTTGALISTEPVRDIIASASDTITAATRVLVFPDNTGLDYDFLTTDVGRKIRITSSSSGNNGFYWIVDVPSSSSVEVYPAPAADETAGFAAVLYEGGALSKTLPTDAGDTITSATAEILFDGITSGSPLELSSSDVGKPLVISSSGSGNNGVYEITAVDSSVALGPIDTATVSPAPPSDEATGFYGKIFDLPEIDRFSYSGSIFSSDDVGRILRISGSTYNDGDYEISEIVRPERVRVEPLFNADGEFAIEETGFFAEVYERSDLSITVTDDDGISEVHTVLDGLEAIVEVGDTVYRFQRLTNGVRIWDKINDPGFVESRLGRSGISRFLTQNASFGVGNSDETKALTLLEEHLWIPQALVEAASESLNTGELFTFLENLKPQWSEFVFAFSADFEETLDIEEDLKPSDISLEIDLTTIFRNSWQNYAVLPDQYQYSGTCVITTDQVRALSGTRAINFTSHFSDNGSTFSTSDIGRTIEISGSGSGNDGKYVITHVLNSDEVFVTPDFAATEDPFTGTSNVLKITHITDSSATFTSDTSLGDVVQIEEGQNLGHYEVLDVIDDNNLTIFETNYDGPFDAEEVDREYHIISQTWNLDQGSLDFLENFSHERPDGFVVDSTTFRVNGAVNLLALRVKPGLNLVIRDDTNSNMGVYQIASVVNETDVTISGSFSTTSVTESYAISSVAIHLTNPGAPPPNDAAEPI